MPDFDPTQPFDVQSPAGAPMFDSSKPFDIQDDTSPQNPKGGFWRNVGAGLEEVPGDVLSTLGAIGRIKDPTLASFQAIDRSRGENAPQPETYVSDALDRGAAATTKAIGNATGLQPEDVSQNTFTDKLGRATGSMLPALVAPEAEAPELADAAASLGSKVIDRFANAPIKTVGRRATTGAGATLGSTTAQEAVPDDDPTLKSAVSVLGAIAGGGLAEAPSLAKSGISAVKNWAAPFSTAGRDQIAADTIRGRAANPATLDARLNPDNAEIVTGSQPTTFQQTGDMGLGSLERETAAKNPAAFNQRRTDQNAARTAALANVQQGGNPDDVGAFMRAQFQDFDNQTQQHIDDLTAQAQARTEGLGGAGLPEEHGVALRTSLQDAENTARAKERSLWQSVDPDRSLVINTDPVKQAATDIAGGMSSSAKPMMGEEADIFDVAQNYDPQMPFADLADLRSRTSAAMRQELVTNGSTPAYARLTRLRGAIQNNISDAATNQSILDSQGVAAGTVAPSQTLAAKIKGWADDFYQNRAAQSGTASGDGIGGSATPGTTSLSGADGAGLSSPRGFRSSQGDQGVPPQPFDQGAADRLAEATQATKERAQAFGAAPIKQVLAKAGTQDAYRLPEATVPQKFFHPGPTGFQDVQTLRQTVGDAAALPILQDYAASSLRKAAENPNGTLNPTKVAAWQAKHADSLRAFPELNAAFSDAANMSNTIADAAASRKIALNNFRSSALGKVMGAQNADDVTKTVGTILGGKNSTQAMQDLAQEAAKSPAAMDGLRQSVADHITKNFISNTEAGTSGQGLIKSDQFQSFLKKNRSALAAVFQPDEMKTLDSIAADLNRANRSITATKLPGGSNTPQDIHGITSNNNNATVLDRALSEAGAATAGAAVAHATGAGLGWMGAKVANAFRASGLQKVDDLVSEAMLNPSLARDLLRRAPAQADSPQAVAMASRLRRVALATAAIHIGAPSQQPTNYAEGGRTGVSRETSRHCYARMAPPLNPVPGYADGGDAGPRSLADDAHPSTRTGSLARR